MTLVDGTLGPRVRWAFADRTTGASLPPYDDGNLADHVGDDPDHVAANRAALAAGVGVDGLHVVSMAPVHGRDVGHVEASSAEPVPEVVGIARCGRSGDGGLRPSPTGGLT